jgi:hypothetical protein
MISPGNEFAELAALSSSFVGRVTRLGVLSPIGQFFSLGSFLSAEAAHRGKIDELSVAHNGFGHMLGDFFTNSSGHPVCQCENNQTKS